MNPDYFDDFQKVPTSGQEHQNQISYIIIEFVDHIHALKWINIDFNDYLVFPVVLGAAHGKPDDHPCVNLSV